MAEALLAVEDLSKRYSVTVLNRARLDVRAGEIHALLGANGAGKSTICRIIAGLIKPTSGTMLLAGRTYRPANKQSAEAAGVQIVQQELNLISTLTVAENILLGRMPQTLGLIDRRRLRDRARRALDRFDLKEIDTDAVADSLGIGRQQMVEIATALDRDCRLLILDEPTAALSAGETETLFLWLDKLRSQGVGIIYISHRLEEVARIADRATVLRDGSVVCTEDTAALSTDKMVELMTGEDHDINRGGGFLSLATESPAIRVEGFSRAGVVHDVSFEVRRGERFGIAGLVGAGRTELLRLIYGADRADHGHVFLRDETKPRCFHHPRQAVAAGIAMVTEDRKANGLLLTQSVRVNTTLATMKTRFSRVGLIRSTVENREVTDLCRRMETRCTSIEQAAGTLSGGNQQKVAVAKWLLRDADVYLFDEPTRGIDVSARRRIYQLFHSLAEKGKALVIVSSDVEELLETCDRIAVMSAGRLVDVFPRSEASQDRIMQAAFSHHVSRRE
jgi:ribose transport system ATP-binding protein